MKNLHIFSKCSTIFGMLNHLECQNIPNKYHAVGYKQQNHHCFTHMTLQLCDTKSVPTEKNEIVYKYTCVNKSEKKWQTWVDRWHLLQILLDLKGARFSLKRRLQFPIKGYPWPPLYKNNPDPGHVPLMDKGLISQRVYELIIQISWICGL